MKQVGDYGDIIISDDVIKRIIEETAEAVEGVAELSKNVKISQKDDRLQVDLFVTIYYGTKIPNLSWDIQQKVKAGVEQILDIKVSKININIHGIQFPQTS